MFKSLVRKYSLPGLKRWLFFSATGLIIVGIGLALIFKAHPVTLAANFIWDILSWVADYVPPTVSGIVAIVLGAFFLIFAFFSANKRVLNLVAPNESSLFETLDRYHMEGKGLKIVTIGGGTGLSNMLRGLKNITSNITAVVTVADDGGSSGRLRKEMDIVPPGDIRNCIAALAADEEIITKLFQYRFGQAASADLRGHSFGNLFLTALVELGGSKNMAEAVNNACSILKTRGRVLPVSNEPMFLIAEMEDGAIVEGESKIPEAEGKIKELRCKKPKPHILPDVLEEIKDADLIVLGPGSLYTSIIPNLLVPELTEAIHKSSATKIYVCNVMTQPGETTGFSVGDHVRVLNKHASGKKVFDYVIANDALPEKRQLQKYKEQEQFPVEIDSEVIQELGVEIYSTNLIQKGDLVRHNFRKLTKAIMNIYIRDQDGKEISKVAHTRELMKYANN